jgi:hypothetical protein
MGDVVPDAIYIGDELQYLGSLPTYEEAVAADGPLSWWKLDEDNSATSAVDTMGVRNLTREGAGTLGIAGINASSTAYDASLGGTGRWVTSAWDWTSIKDANTIECWAAPLLGTRQRIMGNYQSSSIGTTLLDLNAVGGVRAYLPYGPGALSATAPNEVVITDGAWHHCVVTRSHQDGVLTLEVYVDGERVIYATRVVADAANHIANFRVGGYGASGAEPLLGKIDQAAVYDYVLSPNRIKVHYWAGVATRRDR